MKYALFQKYPIKGFIFSLILLGWIFLSCQVLESPDPASQLKETSSTPSLLSPTALKVTPANSLSITEWTDRWLINPPCLPPCWEGVTPGETPADEALEIYKNNPLFSKVEVYVSEGTTHVQILLYWQVRLENDNVEEMVAYSSYHTIDNSPLIEITSFRTPSIRLGQVIEALGEPSHVKTTTEFGNPNHIATATPSETDYYDGPALWDINIIWATKGFSINQGGKPPVPPIDENLELEWVWYFPAGIENFEKNSGTSLFGVDFVSLWKGYGDYEDYMSPISDP